MKLNSINMSILRYIMSGASMHQLTRFYTVSVRLRRALINLEREEEIIYYYNGLSSDIILFILYGSIYDTIKILVTPPLLIDIKRIKCTNLIIKTFLTFTTKGIETIEPNSRVKFLDCAISTNSHKQFHLKLHEGIEHLHLRSTGNTFHVTGNTKDLNVV